MNYKKTETVVGKAEKSSEEETIEAKLRFMGRFFIEFDGKKEEIWVVRIMGFIINGEEPTGFLHITRDEEKKQIKVDCLNDEGFVVEVNNYYRNVYPSSIYATDDYNPDSDPFDILFKEGDTIRVTGVF